jgi:hypothetical protein
VSTPLPIGQITASYSNILSKNSVKDKLDSSQSICEELTQISFIFDLYE